MSLVHEWQLVAHQPAKLTAAQGAVALAIARRIKPGNTTEPIPQRTLESESVGVSSSRTIQRALVELQRLGLIKIQSRPGSRKPSLITWLLECPDNCQIDHAKGNAKKATRANPDTLTRSNPDTPLRSIKKERRGLLSFIEESLELSPKGDDHLGLAEALKDPTQRELIQTRAEQLAVKADNPEAYLKSITRDKPRDLLPRPPKQQAAPDYSHLRLEIQEALARKAAL